MNSAAFTHNRYFTSRTLWSLVLTAIAAVAAIGFVAPLIDASRYGERIRQTLELTLGRSVQFQAVHFTLFSGPGFSLEGVTIGEDPRYGIEAFAYVPEMQVRVRPDKLMIGQIQISNLRLLEPSLNLVKRDDGTWNAVELVQRLSTPRRSPLNLFPVFEVLRGRMDFKFGTRKTTLYLLDSDLQIFPEHSNRLNIRFSGSPARTDRAGNGFGHLHGTISWFLNRKRSTDNQVEADLTLDPSNLSEIATLVEGHDLGIHGTIASHASVSGMLAALQVQGHMQLSDVHRWDLMPASGNDWQVPYGGNVDLPANRLELQTVPGHAGETSPIDLLLSVRDFLTNPTLTVKAHLDRVPAGEMLPLGRRLGLTIPNRLALEGVLGGDISFTNREGLTGDITLANVTATLPDAKPLHADRVDAALLDDRMVFRPAEIRSEGGLLEAGGEVWLATSRSHASVAVTDYPVAPLKQVLSTWLGSAPVFDALTGGRITGALSLASPENKAPVWSGRFEFSEATMTFPGLALPVTDAAGRVNFSGTNLEMNRVAAQIGERPFLANYRYNEAAKRTERLRLELPQEELGDLENILAPSMPGQGWLARLGVFKRSIPAWLADRDMDVDLSIHHLMAGSKDLGILTSQVTWQGTNLGFSAFRLQMPAGSLQGKGVATLLASRPRCAFTGSLQGYRWHGGVLDAIGNLETFGLGADALRNLQISGTFTGTNVRLTSDDPFPEVTGNFLFSYRDGWADLRIPALQATDREGEWNGVGAAQNDGRLIFDLEQGGQQRRVVSALSDDAENPALVANH